MYPWHVDGKGPQPGTKMLTGANAWAEESQDWSGMQSSGCAMCCRQVPARKATETSNAFETLSSDDPEARDPPKPDDRPKPVTSLPLRLTEDFNASRGCCGRTSIQRRYIAGAPNCLNLPGLASRMSA